MDSQRTLRRPISCVGIGLHSGNKVQLSLKPAAADSGIRFRRTDLGNLEHGLHGLDPRGQGTGMTEDEYRNMMIGGGRSIEGNRFVGEKK